MTFCTDSNYQRLLDWSCKPDLRFNDHILLYCGYVKLALTWTLTHYLLSFVAFDATACKVFGRGVQPTGVRMREKSQFYVITEGAGEAPIKITVRGPGTYILITKYRNYIFQIIYSCKTELIHSFNKKIFLIRKKVLYVYQKCCYNMLLKSLLINQKANSFICFGKVCKRNANCCL